MSGTNETSLVLRLSHCLQFLIAYSMQKQKVNIPVLQAIKNWMLEQDDSEVSFSAIVKTLLSCCAQYILPPVLLPLYTTGSSHVNTQTLTSNMT